MCSKTTININIFLLVFTLFAGQVAAQIHSAKHPFHKAEQSCETFSCLIKAGHAPITGDFYIAHSSLSERRTKCVVQISRVSHREYSHYARAPPFLF